MKVSFSQSQKTDPESKSGVKIPYSPGKRSSSKILWWSILALVFAPLFVLLWHILVGWLFVSSPGIITMDSFPIASPENGFIIELPVRKGSDVESGSLAARLRREPSVEITNQIALMKAERDSLKSSLHNTVIPRPLSTKLVDQNIAFFKKEAETISHLMDQGAATRAELNLAKSNLRSAMAERESIVSVRVDDTTEKNIKSRLDYYNRSIEYLESFNASFFDVVIKKPGRIQSIQAFLGQSVKMGDELLWIADPGSVKVIVYVAPGDFDKIKLNSKVKIVLPGSSKRIKAVVEEMPTFSQSTPGGLGSGVLIPPRSVAVFLKLEEPLPQELIVDGLPVKVEWGLISFLGGTGL